MKKKKDGDIADLFRRIAAKKDSSSSPSVLSPETAAHDSIPSTNVSRISGDIVPVPLTNARTSGYNVILEEAEGQANEGSGRQPAPPFIPPPPPPLVYDPDRLPQDPGERKPIASYPINDQDAIRWVYILKGPIQQCTLDYEKRHIGTRDRSFNPIWFYKYPWLEYSAKKDGAFCFVCYLFKKGGHKIAFVDPGWRNWNREDALDKHVGKVDSAHNAAKERYLSYLTPSAQIDDAIVQVDSEERRLYKMRLTYSIRCLRFLLKQGMAFRGHDESDESHNRGNFLELLKWLAENNEEVDKYVLKNAPSNCTLTSPDIQREVIQCCAIETRKKIIEELGDDHYAILACVTKTFFDRPTSTFNPGSATAWKQ